MTSLRTLVGATVVAVALAGCGGTTVTTTERAEITLTPPSPTPDATHPDVTAVHVEPVSGDAFRVSVTISSPYDSPDRYADAFRVLAPNGDELGVRDLTHPHADEQPFTRDLELTIPDDVGEITVQGRDSRNGWGGQARTVPVPRP